ncbi:alpha/beta-Hydrolases superfamily protein [Perilla frutescens var. hirtella]|uniref:Alpha/beta-Hydrolases superfamily protein n=1 Tax=Perilla frutescens var. hirtella TaxID=608512 RepID=A0AAD4PC00_PERFH|nr:alpha/beta-Hydrolases superfamily protein [Perilla frutescens var. hirtella]
MKTGPITTQINIYGKRIFLLQEESTKEKTWRQLRNERGHTLRCSHYVPSQFPDDSPLPCVIYCHGNSGCRADANEAAVVLLPSNITVFTLDFSGSGLSDGEYVSLGWHEKNDLKVVMSYLRGNEKVSRIGLWGRSMGAVTSLLYGAEDPSIAGMVLDSAFSNLFNLMLELADVYKIRLPKFTVKMALQYMRRVIQKKAKFDIMRLDCTQVAPKTFIPAMFGHAKDDKFIQPRHSDAIFNSYAGDKNIIKFDGDHNSSRPQFYYDSVSIFFYNVLHPPRPPSYSTKIEKYYDLGDVKVGAGVEENILYEIIAGLRNVSVDAPSSSAAPRSISSTKSVGELLSDIAPVCNDALISEEADLNGSATSPQQDKQPGQNEECCSYTSSNRESWGRCSSLGSDDLPSMETSISSYDQTTIKVLATPLRNSEQNTLDSPKDDTKKKKKNKAPSGPKKSRREKFEKLEALSQRLRLCILKRVNHRRHCST